MPEIASRNQPSRGQSSRGSKKVPVDENIIPTEENGEKEKRKIGRARNPKMSVSKRLDLHFPVGRIGRYLRKGRFARRVGQSSPVFFAAVLDYMVSELIVVASEKAKASGRATVKPRHIQLAIRDDFEFTHLLGNVTISQGGGFPNILPQLIPAPASNKKKRQDTGEKKKNKKAEDDSSQENMREEDQGSSDDQNDQSESEENFDDDDEDDEQQDESQEYGGE